RVAWHGERVAVRVPSSEVLEKRVAWHGERVAVPVPSSQVLEKRVAWHGERVAVRMPSSQVLEKRVAWHGERVAVQVPSSQVLEKRVAWHGERVAVPVPSSQVLRRSRASLSVGKEWPAAEAGGQQGLRFGSPDSPFAKQLGSAGRPTKARLVLVCHAATTDSRSDELLSGTGDEKCSVQGLREAEQTAELLLDVEVGQLVCSPRLCARQTAQAIAAKRGEAAPEVQVETAIDAMDLGDWTGLSARQVRGSSLAANAEAIESVWNRTREVYTRLCAAANRVGTVVVVGHAASHSAMLCQALGVGMDAIPTFRLESASVSIIEFPDGAVDGDGVLRCTNYTSHIMQKDRP
ncbi:hypothetical protein CYMTET_50703, partial [Cymbomonas tetramitiformis]